MLSLGLGRWCQSALRRRSLPKVLICPKIGKVPPPRPTSAVTLLTRTHRKLEAHQGLSPLQSGEAQWTERQI